MRESCRNIELKYFQTLISLVSFKNRKAAQVTDRQLGDSQTLYFTGVYYYSTLSADQ